jgi:beta-1,4-mannosyl-glycoprotein beta-1,4-N-acetylglucosaminyltransferase
MKIIDTFLFFNELTLLDLRLNVLNEYVDEFVLVEATRSHQNKLKPLFYQENKHLFERFNHKIKHVVIDTFPEHSYWSHDAYQRDYIINGVRNAYQPNDIIFISDLDEIWNPKTLMPVLGSIDENKIYRWQSLICYFYFNLVASPGYWIQPMFMKNSLLAKLDREGYKITSDMLRNSDKKLNVENVTVTQPTLNGWHFSYTEDPIYKLQNFTHSEYSGITREQLQEAINNNTNPFHKNQMYTVTEKNLAEYLPEYVIQNMDKYDKFILRK